MGGFIYLDSPVFHKDSDQTENPDNQTDQREWQVTDAVKNQTVQFISACTQQNSEQNER